MKKRLITINDLIFFLIILIISIIGNDKIMNSPVLPQIRAGEWMIDNGKILTKDIFSYTMAGKEWINVNWLMQLIYGGLYKLGGLRGVVSFTAVTIAFTFSMIISYLSEKKINLLWGIPFILAGIYFSMIQWLAMPFTMNLLFCVLYFIILEKYYKNNSRILYLIPVIQVLWVNINAEYVYGYLIIILYSLGVFLNYFRVTEEEKSVRKNQLKKILIILFISLLCVLLNPFGFKLITETIRWYREVFIYRMGDWQSPNFNGFALLIGYFWLFVVFCAAIFRKNKNDIGYQYIVLFLFWQFMFLYAQRNSVLFILFMLLTVPEMIYVRTERISKIKKIIETVQAKSEIFIESGGLKSNLFFILAVVVFLAAFNNRIEERYPTQIWEQVLKPIEYMKKNGITGRGIHTDMDGNIIIWKMYPEMKVFIDNRPNFYSMKVLDDYGKIYSLNNGWDKAIERYGAEWLSCRSNMIFEGLLSDMKDKWEKVYDDGYTTIFTTKEYYKKNRDRIKKELKNNR